MQYYHFIYVIILIPIDRKCLCTAGYTGQLCEIIQGINECNPNPCASDASCESVGRFRYICHHQVHSSILIYNEACKFPFEYNGATYWSCTDVDISRPI